MDIKIRPFKDNDLDQIVELSLFAWEPVFISFEKIMGPRIYPLVYPDWQAKQAEVVVDICMDKEKSNVLIAEFDGKVIGFLTYVLREENATGEVQLLAVHPDYQNQGIGTELNIIALEKMREAGMKRT